MGLWAKASHRKGDNQGTGANNHANREVEVLVGAFWTKGTMRTKALMFKE